MLKKITLWSLMGLVLGGIFLALYFRTSMLYPGNSLYYALFTFSYFALLVSALKYYQRYSYVFLAVFLWLGFWLKFSVHTVFQYQYRENVGNFDYAAASWDKVLLIASLGSWAVLLANSVLTRFKLASTITTGPITDKHLPAWYPKYGKFLFANLLLVIVLASLANMILGVAQTGLISRTVFIWPFTSIFMWLMGIGFALMLATCLWWELQSSQRAGSRFLFALAEPFCCSISLLSRSIYINHFVPVFIAFALNKKQLSPKGRTDAKTLLAVLVLSGSLFFLTLQTVSALRDYYYLGIPVFKEEGKVSATLRMIRNLMVDRWMGIEGVMAVSSYPATNLALLKQGLLEKPNPSKAGMYQSIAQSMYLQMDTRRFTFATLPGPIAFFYYSGSLWIVGLGMFLLTALMQGVECVVQWLTRNLLLVSVVAMDLAYSFAQFGVMPMLMVKHLILIFGYCLLVWMVQARGHKTLSVGNALAPSL